MTRNRFDQFSKQLLDEFLSPFGTVETSLEIPGEPRLVDLYFSPARQSEADPQTIGLLGRFAVTPCLIEPFRNSPTATEIRDCLLKLFWVQTDLQRKANRQNQRLLESELPRLWILASSIAEPMLAGFATSFDRDWLPGIHFMGTSFRAAVIAINQLPTTEETLWLRLLGKGRTQGQAISELFTISETDPRRRVILQLLTTWKITLEASGIGSEDQEVFMKLSEAYLQWERETLQQGLQQERRLVIENLLKTRFGELDERLTAIVPQLLSLPPETYTRLILQSSREELLDRFSQ